MRPRSRTVEQELARLAGGAYGVVARAELLAARLTAAEIASRLRNGALLREHPGVYRVVHRAPSIEARYLGEQDRRREREAHARGDELRRYTHDDVFKQPAGMLAELRALVGDDPSRPG